MTNCLKCGKKIDEIFCEDCIEEDAKFWREEDEK
jgi:hypothetical protein